MFYLDDIPAESIVIDPPPVGDDNDLDVTEYTAADVELIDPAGDATALAAVINDDGVIEATLPDDVSLFTVAGLYRVRTRLSAGGHIRAIPDFQLVVVDPDSEWHNLDTARTEWTDAENIPDVLLYRVLEAARLDVWAFAPLLAEDAPIPQNYRDGQVMQARNRWNARRVSPDGSMGSDDFIIRPFPLDWHIRATLRPKRAVGGIA